MGVIDEESQPLNLPEYSEQGDIELQNCNEGSSTENSLALSVTYVYVKGYKYTEKTAIFSFAESSTVRQAADYVDNNFPGFSNEIVLRHQAVFFAPKGALGSLGSYQIIASLDGKLSDIFPPRGNMLVSNDVEYHKKQITIRLLLCALFFLGFPALICLFMVFTS